MRVNSALALLRYSRRTGTLAKSSVTTMRVPGRCGDRFDRQRFLGVRDDARADLFDRVREMQLEPRDRRDRSEPFAAKSERRNRFQIVRLRELARGVTPHGKRQFVRRNAAAVVDHFDAFGAAALEHDGDARRARVERVLDELFDDRLRAFDHFAGGDLADGDGIEQDGSWTRDMPGLFARHADLSGLERSRSEARTRPARSTSALARCPITSSA